MSSCCCRGAFTALIASLVLSCTAPETTAQSESASAVQPRAASPQTTPFTVFESGQVRPLAMSPDRRTLFAVNTPDNRLEIFRIGNDRLIRTASIPVGLEPVAV